MVGAIIDYDWPVLPIFALSTCLTITLRNLGRTVPLLASARAARRLQEAQYFLNLIRLTGIAWSCELSVAWRSVGFCTVAVQIVVYDDIAGGASGHLLQLNLD